MPVLSCDPAHYPIVDVLKAIIQEVGYRIFDLQLKCFLPKASDLRHLPPGFAEPKLNDILVAKGFRSLFFFDNALDVYAEFQEDKTIHFINPYLLGFFLKHGVDTKNTPEFSYEIAPNLARFVTMFDAQIIPVYFYDYYKKPRKILNYSGLDINNPGRKIFVKSYIFELSDREQTIYTIAAEGSSLVFMDKIRKEESLNDTLVRILRDELKIANDFVGARVDRTVEFDRDRDGYLTPRLVVFIYVDKIKNQEIIEERSQRGWKSLK